jgi:hypothetical protein
MSVELILFRVGIMRLCISLFHDNRGFHVEDRGPLHRRAEGANGLLDEGAAPGIFLRRRQIGVTKGVMKLPAAHDAIGADARRNSIQAGRQYGRNPDSVTLFRDRSPATSTGASGRWQDDGIDAALEEYLGDLRPDAFHGVQIAAIAHGHKQLIQQLADHPLPFHGAHGI